MVLATDIDFDEFDRAAFRLQAARNQLRDTQEGWRRSTRRNSPDKDVAE